MNKENEFLLAGGCELKLKLTEEQRNFIKFLSIEGGGLKPFPSQNARDAMRLMNELDDIERIYILNGFCKFCGNKNPQCTC